MDLKTIQQFGSEWLLLFESTTIGVLFLGVLFLGLGWWWLWPSIRLYRQRNRILEPVPRGLPFGLLYYLIGNVDLVYYCLRHLSPAQALYQVMSSLYAYNVPTDGLMWFVLGWKHTISLYSAQTMEPLMNSAVNISKSIDYQKLNTWMGDGLLTSTGDHWRRHRKVLTPAFHFRILESFVPILNECSQELNDKIGENSEGTPPPVDIRPLITGCTLDTICETAMGVRIGAQSQTSNAMHYVRPLKRLMEMVIERVVNPLYKSDLLYWFFPAGREFRKNLQIVRQFVNKVIEERRQEWQLAIRNGEIDLDRSDGMGHKRRYALLDTLLLEHLKAPEEFRLKDIEDEVNTFMFEGHDTTAAALIFALLLIGDDQQVQDKIYAELVSILGDDHNTSAHPITIDHCRQMKYLEQCLKESLRLYPPVPFVARELEQDLLVGPDYRLPAGCQCLLYIYTLHRNPEVFPQPERFRPERFAPDSPIHRQPYAYLPFSAGPRNCIGQRFAMLEMKVVIASLLRQFRIISITKRDEIQLEFAMVLKTNTPIMIQFEPRK